MNEAETRAEHIKTPAKDIPRSPTVFSDICEIYLHRFNGMEYIPIDPAIMPFTKIRSDDLGACYYLADDLVPKSQHSTIISIALKAIVENFGIQKIN